jgi:hypothetical protein
MAPASTPLVVFSGIFIRQQARRFISAKYQRQSLNHRDGSTNSSTINGSTSAGSSLSAAVAISVVMLLFVIFIITWYVVLKARISCTSSPDAKQNYDYSFLGYAVIKTRKKLPNQSDQTLEERKQRIFSQMAAPIMRKTLDLNPITPTLAESFHDNQESSGLLESGMVSGHQHRETVSYNENEGQDHIWYFHLFLSLNNFILTNSL